MKERKKVPVAFCRKIAGMQEKHNRKENKQRLDIEKDHHALTIKTEPSDADCKLKDCYTPEINHLENVEDLDKFDNTNTTDSFPTPNECNKSILQDSPPHQDQTKEVLKPISVSENESFQTKRTFIKEEQLYDVYELTTGIDDMSMKKTVIDNPDHYNLPPSVLSFIHDLIIENLFSFSSPPEFSEVLTQNSGKIVRLEPLYSKSKENISFINNYDCHHQYLLNILFLIIMDQSVKNIGQIRKIFDTMYNKFKNAKIKDTINFFKVYFKCIRHFFFFLKPLCFNLKPNWDDVYIEGLIERKTKSNYMLVPYSEYTWGNSGQNRLAFVAISNGTIQQHIVNKIASTGKNEGATPEQIISDWNMFLNPVFKFAKDNSRVFYNKYDDQKTGYYETLLKNNYSKTINFISFDRLGLSPILHIHKIEEIIDYYNISELFSRVSE